MRILSFKQLEECIAEISDNKAFELCGSADGSDRYIPYIMNDAVEDYILLRGCTQMGELIRDYRGDTKAEAVEDRSGQGIIIRQGSENVVTIWFEEACREQKCYRYHEIGHFWNKGFEHWRRVVYILGTVYDKFTYGGEDLCNQGEIDLLPLMEFAPLREFSPIKESIHQYYPDTYDGVNTIRELAMEVGDTEFVRLTMLYEKHPSYRLAKFIAGRMNSPKRAALYDLIFKRIISASSQFPERDYGPEKNEMLRKARSRAELRMKELGFEGTYPLFTKGNVQYLAAEEHPFTISEMEYHDFDFRIRFMVSECRKKPEYLCQGFFGKAKGRIEEI